MRSVPEFKVYQDEGTPDGVFDWGSSRDELLEACYNAYDSYFMGEIQGVYALKNELYFENSGFDDEETFDVRGKILDDIEKIKKGILDISSKQILKKWKNIPPVQDFLEYKTG